MDELARMKERSKTIWALGDYPSVARRFEGVADDVVAAAGIGAGDRVLDVAAGNGNVATVAARAGADVTASDFTAEAFRVVRPGGVVVVTAWTPDGFTGQVTALMGEYLPAPLAAARPIDWGIETTVRARMAAHA